MLDPRLGVTLGRAQREPVQLTPIGRALVMRARRILLDVKDAREMVRL